MVEKDIHSVRNMFTNFSWQVGFNVLRATLGLVTSIVLARQLGVNSFGELQYALSIYFILQTTELFSHNSIIKSLLLNKEDQHSALMGASFIINMSIFLISFTMLLVILFFTENNIKSVLVIACGCLGIFARSFNCVPYYFDSILKSKTNAFSQFLGNITSNLLRIFISFFTLSLLLQTLLFSLQFFVTSSRNVWVYRKKLSIRAWSFDKKIALKILKLSSPLFLASVSTTILLRIDSVMIKHLASAKELGYYSVATKLSEPWVFIISAFITSIFPAITLLRRDNKTNQYLLKLRKSNSIALLMGGAVCIGVFFVSKPLIQIAYGSEYTSSISLLQIHIWSTLFLFISNLQHIWEVNEDYLKFSMYKNASGAVVNIILNLYAIPKYGALGASVTTLVSYFWIAYVFNIFTTKSRGYLKLQIESVLKINLLKR